jgi:Tfp pilus assembly protein PilX
MSWIFGIVAAVVVILLIIGLVDDSQQKARQAENKALSNQKLREAEAALEHFEKALADAVETRTRDRWKFVSKGKLMHIQGQPQCLAMMSDNGLIVRFEEVVDDNGFATKEPISLNLNQIVSLDTASPTITKSRKTSVPVTVTETKQKSPVARGLVGSVLLGPAGLVLGAASGLNAKVTTKTENQTIYEKYESSGDPQLILGTSSPNHPVLKIKFDPPNLAEEWMFRIRGAQASGGFKN